MDYFFYYYKTYFLNPVPFIYNAREYGSLPCSLRKVSKVKNSMKTGKASGPEGISAELLKSGIEKLRKMPAQLFESYVNRQYAGKKARTT